MRDENEEMDVPEPQEKLTCKREVNENKLTDYEIGYMTPLCKMIWDTAKNYGCTVQFAMYYENGNDVIACTINKITLNHSLFALCGGIGSEVVLSNTNIANNLGIPEYELNVYHSIGCDDDGQFHLYPDAETVPFVDCREWWDKFFKTLLNECSRLEQMTAIRDIKKSARAILNEQ